MLWHQLGDSAMRVVKQHWQLDDDNDDGGDDGGGGGGGGGDGGGGGGECHYCHHFYCDISVGSRGLGTRVGKTWVVLAAGCSLILIALESKLGRFDDRHDDNHVMMMMKGMMTIRCMSNE